MVLALWALSSCTRTEFKIKEIFFFNKEFDCAVLPHSCLVFICPQLPSPIHPLAFLHIEYRAPLCLPLPLDRFLFVHRLLSNLVAYTYVCVRFYTHGHRNFNLDFACKRNVVFVWVCLISFNLQFYHFSADVVISFFFTAKSRSKLKEGLWAHSLQEVILDEFLEMQRLLLRIGTAVEEGSGTPVDSKVCSVTCSTCYGHHHWKEVQVGSKSKRRLFHNTLTQETCLVLNRNLFPYRSGWDLDGLS